MGTVSIAVPYDDRWYFAEILRGAQDRLELAGHQPLVHVFPPSPEATVDAVDAVDVDFRREDCIGAIAVGIKYREDQRERSLAWTKPLVMIGGSVTGWPSVLIDDIGGAFTATDHLMELGHTRIAHIAGTLEGQMAFAVHSRRAKGYRRAMERAGLPMAIVEADFDADEVKAKALELLGGRDRPTAVFVHADEMAFAVLDAAEELGIAVGPELSVVGFDDHPEAERRGLTTIRQRPAELGDLAAEMLMSGLESGPDPKRSRLASTGLVVRGSTRRLR